MKLIIQIPCYNEEKTLKQTIADLPKKIDGIDTIEYLIVDDGSTDKTVEVAKELGVHHIVSFKQNKGLAFGFVAGMDECLHLGADIIVNTDADNQYYGGDIPKLVLPILENRADIVIGERPISEIEHFSKKKKRFQKIGSWVVRVASKSNVPDAPSGFRAYSREAALRINVVNEYTYTLETIIQAGRNKMAMVSVPIRTNAETRKSRLFKSMWSVSYTHLDVYKRQPMGNMINKLNVINTYSTVPMRDYATLTGLRSFVADDPELLVSRVNLLSAMGVKYIVTNNSEYKEFIKLSLIHI